MEQKKLLFQLLVKNADKTIVFGVNEIELKKVIRLFLQHHVQQIVLPQWPMY